MVYIYIYIYIYICIYIYIYIYLFICIDYIQEKQKSRKMEDTMLQLDKEIKRSDDLLYQMIPRATADQLRKGESVNSICKVRIC